MKHAVVVKGFTCLFLCPEEGTLHSLASSFWPEVQVQGRAPPFLWWSPPSWPVLSVLSVSHHSGLHSFDGALLMWRSSNKQQLCALPEGSSWLLLCSTHSAQCGKRSGWVRTEEFPVNVCVCVFPSTPSVSLHYSLHLFLCMREWSSGGISTIIK